MLKKLTPLVATLGIGALSLFLFNCGSSSSRPTGLLYVLTQGSNGLGNNISSFAINLGSGNLSLVNSNAPTCKTAGACGLPLDIVLDPTGATAFVLNQNAISSYTVNSDGSFGAPSDPLLLTNTAIAMARDAAGQFLFVLQAASDPLLVACPQIASSDPSFAGCPSISTFAIQPGSTTLTPASGSPLYIGRTPTALSAIAFTPTGGSAAQEFLFVTGNHDLTTSHFDNTVSVFNVDSTGVLSEKVNSPYSVASVDPISVIAVNTNPVGQSTGGVFVYVGSQPTTAGALNIFQMCTVLGQSNCAAQDVSDFNLVAVTSPAPPATGQDPVAMVVDPTNNFLYMVCSGSNQVFGYKINTTAGGLTALSPASQPTGARPVALALHPSVGTSGQFLYTSNSAASNISGFNLSVTSGSMSTPISVTSPSTPSGMVAK